MISEFQFRTQRAHVVLAVNAGWYVLEFGEGEPVAHGRQILGDGTGRGMFPREQAELIAQQINSKYGPLKIAPPQKSHHVPGYADLED